MLIISIHGAYLGGAVRSPCNVVTVLSQACNRVSVCTHSPHVDWTQFSRALEHYFEASVFSRESFGTSPRGQTSRDSVRRCSYGLSIAVYLCFSLTMPGTSARAQAIRSEYAHPRQHRGAARCTCDSLHVTRTRLHPHRMGTLRQA